MGNCRCTLNPKPLHHHPSLSSPLEPKPKSSNNLMQKTTTLFMDLPSCTSTSLILPLIVLLATSQGNPPKTKHIAHLPFIANLLSHTQHSNSLWHFSTTWSSCFHAALSFNQKYYFLGAILILKRQKKSLHLSFLA